LNINLNKYEHRVRYSDTDHGGVVYYARYLDMLEAGRSELLRENNLTYADFEKKGFIAPVVHLEIDYHNSAVYDDLVVTETKIDKIGNSSINFSYKLYRKSDNLLIAEAKTVNVYMDWKKKKPTKVPDEIRNIIK
jgi:acyl-CoA thioester hydrolase